MSNWTEDVHQQAVKVLGSKNRIPDDLEAYQVIQAARKDFGLPPINLYMVGFRRSFRGKATIKQNGDREIRQAENARIDTLLHEIAHHFKGGFNHGAAWVWAFFTLVTWFYHEDNKGRFGPIEVEL